MHVLEKKERRLAIKGTLRQNKEYISRKAFFYPGFNVVRLHKFLEADC